MAWGRYRKGLYALAGLLAQGLNAGLVPAPYDKWVAVVLAALAAAGVVAASNDPLPAPKGGQVRAGT